MLTASSDSFEMENPVADKTMSRFAGTRVDNKVTYDFVETRMAPLHFGREPSVTPSVVLGEIGEARDFVQKASAALSATKLPRTLTTSSFAATVMRSMGNTVAQLKQVAPWAIGVLQWPIHLAVIFVAYAVVSWMERALAREGLGLPSGAFKTNLHPWWPLARHSALQAVICDFQKTERASRADGTYVPWRQRPGKFGLKREWALFVIETMYILVIIATFQLASLGGPFCAFGCAVGVYCILKTHQIMYVVTAAYAPPPLFYAQDFDHPMRLAPDDPRHGKDLVLDSAGTLVEFTDDQYRVELTKVDPGLPYINKFRHYKKEQKHTSLQSKGFIAVLTVFSQVQILATESNPPGERQPFFDNTAQVVADAMGALTVIVCLLETALSVKRNPHSASTAAVRDIVQKVGVLIALVISMSGCLVDSSTCGLLAPGLGDQQCELTDDDAAAMTSSGDTVPPESSLLMRISLISKLLLVLGVMMNFVVVASKSMIWKTTRHRITLTSQVNKLAWSHWDGPDALVPSDGIVTIPNWDVSTEIDIRAWRSAWDATLSSDPALAAQHKRLLAQKILSQNVPAVAWSARPTEEQHAAMCTLLHDLSGTDVYMNDNWKDGVSILTASHGAFQATEL